MDAFTMKNRLSRKGYACQPTTLAQYIDKTPVVRDSTFKCQGDAQDNLGSERSVGRGDNNCALFLTGRFLERGAGIDIYGTL